MVYEEGHKNLNHEPTAQDLDDNDNKDLALIARGKNLKLFLSDAALSAETDDETTWFINSSASAHTTCHK